MSYAKYPKEMKEAIIARMLEGDAMTKENIKICVSTR